MRELLFAGGGLLIAQATLHYLFNRFKWNRPMPDTIPNSYAMLRRSDKADKLIAALAAGGWDNLEIVKAMGPEHWASVAKTAGVRMPSPDTIALVVQRIARTVPA